MLQNVVVIVVSLYGGTFINTYIQSNL